ncbi:MAG: hypothetical protein IKZ84_06985, partial [Victivallales bacterium]|nr:hypothetical protein [Victivallales bacterium]
IQSKAKTFTEQAAACDAQDEALSKELEELQRTVAESKEAIDRLDLDFDKRADAQAKQQAKGGKTDYADAYAKLRPAIENAAKEETTGMIQDAQDAITQNQATLEALKTQLAGMDEAIARQKDDIATAQKENDALKKRIMDRMDAFQKIDKTIVDAEAEKERLDTAVSDAQTALDNAANDERPQALEKLKKAQKALDDSTEKLTQLYNDKAKTVTPEAQKELESWKKLFDEQQADLEDAQRTAGRQRDERTVIEARIKAAEAAAKVLAARASFAQEVKKALQLPAEERLAANEALRKRAAALQKAEDKVFGLQSERAALQKQHLATYKTEGAKVLAVFKQQEDALNERIRPVQEDYNARKQNAVNAYVAYLKRYPKSKNAPVSMARMSGALLELEKPAEAVAALTKLMETFPEYDDRQADCNPAKACQTLYSLARAQAEAGQTAESAASYKRLLESAKLKAEVEAFPLPKLRYLAEKGLEINAPDITYFAGQQILAQAAAGKPAAAALSKGILENTAVVTAEAAVKTKKPKIAIEILNKLLADNPKTARFFDAKFLLADAMMAMNPPDTDGAEQALNEIGNFTKNPAVANQALCKAAQILAKSDQEDKRRQALSRFHMVLDFADQTDPENLPWIEQSIAGAVKLHKSLDIDTDLIPKLTATYKKLFPQGQLLK